MAIKAQIKQQWTDWTASESGTALIEFAVCLMVIVILLLGGIELSRYILIVHKMQAAVSAESNVISAVNPSDKTITKNDMNMLVGPVFSDMLKPFDLSSDSILILTDMYVDPNGTEPKVKWRYCGGTLTKAKNGQYVVGNSKFGKVGGKADLSSLPSQTGTPFTMEKGEEIVAAEIYYDFKPILPNAITNSLISARKIYYASVSVPRFAQLTGLVGTSFSSNCQ